MLKSSHPLLVDPRIPACIHVCDVSGHVLQVTDAWTDLTGYSRSEIIGQLWTSLLAPTAAGAATPPGAPQVIVRKDGTRRFVLLTEHCGSSAEAGARVVCLSDVTAQVEASRRAAELADSLRLAEEAGEIGTLDSTIGVAHFCCSAQFRRLLGLEPGADCDTATWLAAVHPDDRQQVAAALATAAGHVEPLRFEYRVLWPDGTVRWLSTRCQYVLAPDGAPARRVGATVDITERKQSENALRQSRDRFARLFEDCPIHLRQIDLLGIRAAIEERFAAGVRDMDAYLRANPREITNIARHVRTVNANPAALALYGFSTLDQFNTNLERTWTPRHIERWREQIVAIARGRVADQFETSIRTPRGERDLLAYVSVLEADERGPRMILYSSIDITEHKRLESQLREVQKLDAVGTVAAGVAHDINNILTAILGHAELARHSGPTEEVARAIDGIVEASQQATSLTRSLLTFGRKAERDFEPLDLRRVVDECLRLIRRVLPASIEIEVANACGEGPWVSGDATRLQQVLMNLAINARDAMPLGGKLHMGIEEVADAADETGRLARLVVADNGSGMSEAVLQRLFDPFFTTKSRGQGTGLGMSVVHAIVLDHGGRIHVDSAPGKGTRVTITLPSCEAPTPAVRTLHDDRAPRGRGEVILLGEDNAQVRAILETTLRRADYEVISARDGAEVTELFARQRESIRALIVDLDLPKKSGAACLREIRSQSPGLPAIIITGSVEADAAEFDSENTEMLRKPFRVNELLRAVARLCTPTSVAVQPITALPDPAAPPR